VTEECSLSCKVSKERSLSRRVWKTGRYRNWVSGTVPEKSFAKLHDTFFRHLVRLSRKWIVGVSKWRFDFKVSEEKTKRIELLVNYNWTSLIRSFRGWVGFLMLLANYFNLFSSWEYRTSVLTHVYNSDYCQKSVKNIKLFFVDFITLQNPRKWKGGWASQKWMSCLLGPT